MSKLGRNDRHNTDPIEGKLIHIGHYLWKLYKRAAEPRRILSTLRLKQFGKRSGNTESS
jgi:hypothetical protein